MWPFKGEPRLSPVRGSHRRTVLSMLPVAIVLPSGDQLTTRTQLVWPFKVCTGVPVSQSHILAVESPLPVHNLDEEAGENEVARMASP